MPSTGFPVTYRASQTPTVTVGAYSAGNVVGGLLTFAPLVRRDGGSGILNTATLRDKAGQGGTYDLFLFDAAPTTQTDKTAVALTAADLAKCIGVLTFAAVKLGAASTMGVSSLNSANLSIKVGGGGGSGSSVFGILVTRGTPTYASTSDISVDLLVIPD